MNGKYKLILSEPKEMGIICMRMHNIHLKHIESRYKSAHWERKKSANTEPNHMNLLRGRNMERREQREKKFWIFWRKPMCKHTHTHTWTHIIKLIREVMYFDIVRLKKCVVPMHNVRECVNIFSSFLFVCKTDRCTASTTAAVAPNNNHEKNKSVFWPGIRIDFKLPSTHVYLQNQTKWQ